MAYKHMLWIYSSMPNLAVICEGVGTEVPKLENLVKKSGAVMYHSKFHVVTAAGRKPPETQF